jgi:hypothetical protein
MKNPICDLCNAKIQDGGGHAFYSSTAMSGVVTGNMLLCDSCTDGIVTRLKVGEVTESNVLWSLIASRAGDTASDKNTKIMRVGNIEGIAARCDFHHLGPEAAKTKARELAQGCWSDPTNGPLEAMAFWDTRVATNAKERAFVDYLFRNKRDDVTNAEMADLITQLAETLPKKPKRSGCLSVLMVIVVLLVLAFVVGALAFR